MTDTHSHILFNVDDGSSSIEESIQLLKELQKIGFKNVILTPHYIDSSEYQTNNEEKIAKFNKLKEVIQKNNLDINIYLGNEIFINNDIADLIQKREIHSINNSKYLLIELPFYNQILNLEDILYELKIKGYIPIIAHPERYSYFQEDHDLVDRLKEEEILFQCNYASILGYYGKSAQKLLTYMLKNKYVDYFGTDIHHINKCFVIENFKKIEKHINKIIDKNYYNQIISNGNNLIKNQEE